MEPLRQVEGRAIPFGAKNVDTDVIIPAKWLKTITREGMGRGAFEGLRQDPDNLFDSPEFKGAPILIAGDNFGCGSSREHAAWALLDLGITAVIAPSYSDIFSSNAFKNGILTVVLPQEAIDRLTRSPSIWKARPSPPRSRTGSRSRSTRFASTA
jgi:3-isopropylmalate/(R)-2-methylmalate dehydratase small subunit